MSLNSTVPMKASAHVKSVTSSGAETVDQVFETCGHENANTSHNGCGGSAPSTPKAKSSKPTPDMSGSETNTTNGGDLSDKLISVVQQFVDDVATSAGTISQRLQIKHLSSALASQAKLSERDTQALLDMSFRMFDRCVADLKDEETRDRAASAAPSDVKLDVPGSTAVAAASPGKKGLGVKEEKGEQGVKEPQLVSKPVPEAPSIPQPAEKPAKEPSRKASCKIERKTSSDRDKLSDKGSKISRTVTKGSEARERAREREAEKKRSQQRADGLRAKESIRSAGSSVASEVSVASKPESEVQSQACAAGEAARKQENREGATLRRALKEAGMSRNTVLTEDQKRDFPIDASGGLSAFTQAMMPGIELSSRTRNSLTLDKLRHAFLPRYSGKGFVSTHAPPVWALISLNEYYQNDVYEIEDDRMEVQLETKSKVTYGIIGRCYERVIGPKVALSLIAGAGLAWGFWRRSWRAGLNATLNATAVMALYWPFGSFVRQPQRDVSLHIAHLAKAVRDQIDVSKALVAQKTMSTQYYPSDLTIMYCNHAMRAQWLADMRMSATFASVEPLAAGKHQQHKVKVVDTGFRWNKDNDKWDATRAWSMTTCPLTDCSRLNVPAINPRNLCEARQKRVLFKSEPLPEAIYGQMREVLRVMTHGLAPTNQLPDYVTYATEMGIRKGLSRDQREALINRAREIDNMDDAAVLETLRKGLKTTKFFVKDEPYLKEEANLRFIISPNEDVKIIFGAALRPIEEQTYFESRLHPHLIKGREPNEIREMMLNDFSEPAYYLETDYSNFESTIALEELTLEYEFYKSRTEDNMSREIIGLVSAANLKSAKVTNFQYGAMRIPCMRYSGMPNTALGNALLNFVNIRVAERRAGVLVQRMLVEGDDAIMRFGTDAERSAFFTALREGRFVAHECQFANVGTDLSFCGYKLDDSQQLQPTEEQVAKLSLVFSRQEPSLELCKARLFAKILSYAYRYPEWRELREIALYIEDEYKGIQIHSRAMWRVLNEDWHRSTQQMLDRYREQVRVVVATGSVSQLLRG